MCFSFVGGHEPVIQIRKDIVERSTMCKNCREANKLKYLGTQSHP